MTSRVFCRYDLRTTDPKAAESFYRDVLGPDFAGAPSSDEPSMLAVWLLHEQARARGAPPHWLGQIYSGLFGWAHTETLGVADPVGGHKMFAWEDSGSSVGSMANTARWPGVHAHWLFYFPVADLDASVAKVQAQGGRVSAGPAALANGDRLAPCEDPEGAAFGLLQSGSPV